MLRFMLLSAACLAALAGCHDRGAQSPPPYAPPPYSSPYAYPFPPFTPPGAPPSYTPPSYTPPPYSPPPPSSPPGTPPPPPPPFAWPPFALPQNLPGMWNGSYRLPVTGRWRVHRTHYDLPLTSDQGLAVDLVVDAGHPPQEPGHANSEYPSYGQPIVADAPGMIANAVDGVVDNAVPAMNPGQAYGNFVVIDYLNGEFSLFAHIQPGSLRVHTGDVVVMGQTVGSCGNSGNTSMPHLHYQLMDNAIQGQAHARAIRHLPYFKNGALTTTRLEAGDVIQAQQ